MKVDNKVALSILSIWEFYEKNKWLRHLSQLKSQTLSNFAVNSLVGKAINGIMK